MRCVKNIEARMAKGQCVAWGCTKDRVNRTRYCSRHRRIDFKERYPHAYQYDVLRTSAKKRKIEFKLTYKDFVVFCLATGYMDKKGKRKDDWTIDRIRPNRGYQVGNLQILTSRDNARKHHVDKKIAAYEAAKAEVDFALLYPEDFDWPKPIVRVSTGDIPF